MANLVLHTFCSLNFKAWKKINFLLLTVPDGRVGHCRLFCTCTFAVNRQQTQLILHVNVCSHVFFSVNCYFKMFYKTTALAVHVLLCVQLDV